MSRSGQLPIRMRVEGMRLVPASAFDQEALSAYQNGAIIQVSFWQGRNPDLLRKFWAILSKVVETCNTPWEDKEEAADALKLALGITDVGSTVNGQMFVRPGSIAFNALDEARFRKFFEDSMAILCRITGVDVEELGREAADTGPDHDPETGEITDNTNSDDTPSTASSSDDAGMTPVHEAGADDVPASDAPASNLSRDQKWLLNTTRMLWGATKAGGDPEVFKNQRLAAMDQFPKPDDCDKRISEKANSVSRHCREIIDGSLDPEDGLAVIAGIVGVDQDDILRQAGAA